jgi:hypothetical protein
MYTIGNHERGLPELLFTGDTDDAWAGVLNRLGYIMREQRRDAFRHGELVSVGGKFPVKIVNTRPGPSWSLHLSPGNTRRPTIIAFSRWSCATHTANFRAIPDAQSRMPANTCCRQHNVNKRLGSHTMSGISRISRPNPSRGSRTCSRFIISQAGATLACTTGTCRSCSSVSTMLSVCHAPP